LVPYGIPYPAIQATAARLDKGGFGVGAAYQRTGRNRTIGLPANKTLGPLGFGSDTIGVRRLYRLRGLRALWKCGVRLWQALQQPLLDGPFLGKHGVRRIGSNGWGTIPPKHKNT